MHRLCTKSHYHSFGGSVYLEDGFSGTGLVRRIVTDVHGHGPAESEEIWILLQVRAGKSHLAQKECV